MTDYSFDSNIVIDALNRIDAARAALRAADRAWLSRVCWIEVMSKVTGPSMREMRIFLDGFAIEEVDAEVCERAAALRRERPRLKLPDAVIFASAQANGRILVTRNIKDFPVDMPGIRVPYLFQPGQA